MHVFSLIITLQHFSRDVVYLYVKKFALKTIKMSSIIEFIAKQTGATSFYRSHKFCFDAETNRPSLSYDDSQSFSIKNDMYGENAPSKGTKSLKSLADRIRSEGDALFSYFLDGSRRIYKVDDVEYQKRIFPIVGGQIGVACCQRKTPDSFGKASLERHFVLSMPSTATSGEQHPSQFLGRLTQNLNNLDKVKRFGLSFSEIMIYKADKTDSGREEYMDRGTALIQDKMIECEKKVVQDLVRKNLLTQDSYLVKDGSLQYQRSASSDFKEMTKYKDNYRRVIGVSKSFNPEFSRDKHNKSNASAIANLPLYHRTPAIVFQENRVGNVFFSVWYVRIRERKYSDSPFAGVLKIEKVLVSQEEEEQGLDSGEVDLISANIINERNPVCYGKDQRWANHLYPIFLTESYIKSHFLSDLHFISLF